MIRSVRRLHAAARLVVLLAMLVTAPAAAADPPPPGPDTIRFDVPLRDGQLAVRDLIETVAEQIGVPADARLKNLDWSIDVESALGRIQLGVLNRLTGGVIHTRVREQSIEVSFDREKWRRTLDEAGISVDAWLGRLVDRLPDAGPQSFGVRFLPDPDVSMTLEEIAAAGTVPTRVVILVHGLDDPGWMWRDVIEAVRDAGYVVARFDYPNDGPIADSTDLFAAELMDLRAAGITDIDIVAHSMGGLVSRDVLTRSAYYAGDGRGGERLPAVARLIMAGTPNHGSAMARLRGVSELREQFSRLLDGGRWGASIIDGAGEAGVDLLPGSDFLRRLNARPEPTHTAMTIIAGRISPVSESEAASFVERVARLAETDRAPDWLKTVASQANGRAVRALADGAVRGLGDGCVSLDSAHLDGVDDEVVVTANHVSMIVRLLDTRDTPPAIPIILDRLARPRDAAD